MLNKKGQFSIIAALLVAVVLVASVMATYSSIRYNTVSEQPQILNAVDETNLGLKEILGFTVGYYGSVLKVTGNQTYALQLASKYLQSGLDQTGDVRPEWAVSVNLTSLALKTSWFSNRSYSQGSMAVTYNLAGLGISGASYDTSTRLDVEVMKANQTGQAQLKILMDENQPLINLGKNNLKFFRYEYNISDWKPIEPVNIASYADGTYVLDLPQGISPDSYVIQVEDTRGLMVLASSYSQVTSKLTFNSSSYSQIFDYVDINSTDARGTHGNFTAQQFGPDGIYDTLAEAAQGTTQLPSYPTNYNLINATTWASNPISNLQVNDGNYTSFRSYGSAFNGTANFGYQIQGGTPTNINSIKGSRFTLNQAGLATSISAFLRFTSSSNTFGNTNTGNNGDSIMDSIRGQRFISPAYPVPVQSIAAYIVCTTSAKNMKAAIYDNSGNLVASSTEQSVPANANPAWRTFTFASPPTLTESTNYVLVVWSQNGTGTAALRYSSTSGGNGRFVASQTYDVWPALTLQSNTYQYSIYCNYNSEFKAKAAIYNNTGGSLVGVTDEKTLGTVDNWVTFNFSSQPTLNAADYVLVIWSSDTSNVSVYRDAGSAQRFEASGSTYPNWPAIVSDQSSQRTYSIYCTYSPANQYSAQVEFVGNSTIPLPWNFLNWTVDSSTSMGGVNLTFQLYNAVTGYPTSGDGYMTTNTLGTSDLTMNQIINTNPASYINSSGYWKVMVRAVMSVSNPFNLNLDFVQYSPDVTNYALDLREQWLSVNASNIRQDLCIKTGTLSANESLLVQVYKGGVWKNLTTLLPNCFNNVSLAQYIDSTNLTIRFVGSNDNADPIVDSWNIDAAYIKDEPNVSFLLNLQQSTFTLETMQNGTMRWLGQNIQNTTQTLPIPPVPVKAIHVNQTINGVNQEVPFQIEDWASNYQIPLGLTSNTTVFGNRQMIVFLLKSQVG